ncbi:hypothetical protein HPB47_025199 [Ixodes persulcatus]|uniref:Uncharacterized protein n=1 Tax=Ixodes persulcatus TaxID=34615 RepID=A0AC60Q2V3_IXOPE|nr:hypothetical protein HPB47_025199 [Ixodes persulcatus]
MRTLFKRVRASARSPAWTALYNSFSVSDNSPFILKLGKAETFLQKAINPPSPEALFLSIQFLQTLKALDEGEGLTPLGYHLAKLPLEPQTGKMIIMASIFSCLDPILTVAASLSFKDAFVVPLGKEKLVDEVKGRFAGDTKSDHMMLIHGKEKLVDEVKGRFAGDTKSDHMMLIHQWEEAVHHRNDDSFCFENFLSKNTLKIEDCQHVVSGDHGGNLERHLQRRHKEEYDK